ncbi:MAG: hypothetical protein II985_02485 [Alistipes sp.]|nr:hypothetical protein [Alistipes sp.]
MMENNQYIELLKAEVLRRFGRTLDAPTDYDQLSLDVSEVTGDSLSVSTLKRLYGYDKRSTMPRPSTLSTLSRYVGYAGWSDFCAQQVDVELPSSSAVNAKPSRRRPVWVAVVILAAVGGVVAYMLRPTPDKPASQETTPPVEVQLSAEEIIERDIAKIRQAWMEDATRRCDSIRRYRAEMDVVAYSKLVDNFYFPYLFTTVKQGVERDIESLQLTDTLRSREVASEIFRQCQERCVELMREIAPELNRARGM